MWQIVVHAFSSVRTRTSVSIKDWFVMAKETATMAVTKSIVLLKVRSNMKFLSPFKI